MRMRPRRWHVRVDSLLQPDRWYSMREILDTYISTYGTKFAPTHRELTQYMKHWATEDRLDTGAGYQVYRKKAGR